MSSMARDSGSGSSGVQPVKSKKPSWNRRSWSNQEEDCLLVALKDIVANGWRSDNGFKAGYLNKLEAAMKSKFPETDLKANPHINSKITQWKKNYGMLVDILSLSGVGINPDFTIDCNKDQWEQIIKADGNAKNIRYKPWPYYEDWCECFGKDRANGDTAEDMMEAQNYVNKEYYDMDTGLNQSEFNEKDDELNKDEDQGDSVSQSTKVNRSSKAKGKVKRSPASDIEMVCEALGEIGNKADARFGEMVKLMGFEFDVKNTKKEAFRLLNFVPGLTIKQKFTVCQILAKELDKLDVFMGLSDEERPSYVLFLLEEAGLSL